MEADEQRDMGGVPQTPDELLTLKTAYEARKLTIVAICQAHAVDRRQLYRLARDYGWALRNPRRVDRHDLIERMLRLLEAQVKQLETTVNTGHVEQSAVLSKLVTTLDKLIEIKAAEARQRPARKPGQSRALAELRSKVAERIAEFNQA